LKLASLLLRRGIERYRQRKQGPLLGRASELFARLTLGSFTSLQADFNEQDEPVIVGVRPDGRHVAVDGMSDGSLDQLYLALRLATIESHVTKHEPMPLIVDDILVHFDNARAAVALQCLAELARQTQVILFTHHEHLAQLAMSAGGDVHCLRLDCNGAAATLFSPPENSGVEKFDGMDEPNSVTRVVRSGL
jgi:uncharacterized protein YhaN